MNLRVRLSLVALAVVPASIPAFLAYGMGRTNCETVGFDVRATVVGLICAAVFLVPTAVAAAVFGLVFRARPWTVFVVTPLACGAGVASWFLLEDWAAPYVALIALGAVVAAILHPARERVTVWTPAVLAGVGLLAGPAASETWIQADEARFAEEVARDPGTEHARGRVWPFGDAALVYIPGEGTHATD